MNVTAIFSPTGVSSCVDVEGSETVAALREKLSAELCGADWARYLTLSLEGEDTEDTFEDDDELLCDTPLQQGSRVDVGLSPYAHMRCGSLACGERVLHLSLSACGAWCAAVLFGGAVEVWDTEAGQRTSSLPFDEACAVSAAITPCAQWVYIGTRQFTVTVWPRDLSGCLQHLTGHTQWVRALCCTPCGGSVVSGSDDQTLRVWCAESGTCTLACAMGFRVRAVEPCPEGGRVAVAAVDAVHVVCLSRGCVVQRYATPLIVRGMGFGCAGAGASFVLLDDAALRVFAAPGAAAAVLPISPAAEDGVQGNAEPRHPSLALSPCGLRAAVAHGASVSVWDLQSGRAVQRLHADGSAAPLPLPPPAPPQCVAVSPCGRWLLAGCGRRVDVVRLSGAPRRAASAYPSLLAPW